MSSDPSAVDTLFGSVHRAVLGGLVGIIALAFVGLAARALSSGNYLVGGSSGVLAAGAIAWVGYLFVDGYRDGA
ncbi:hypothetical protein [Halococcus sp. AFM35]|uniref:hypothetical protein n=1 Tax=Halococcus sp. AFM35 TaxID=3421653 RepID=UPI003EBF4C0E